jgi:hypothetical protein
MALQVGLTFVTKQLATATSAYYRLSAVSEGSLAGVGVWYS